MKAVIGILMFISLNALGAPMQKAPEFHLTPSHDPMLNQTIASADCPNLNGKKIHNSYAANKPVASSTRSARTGTGADGLPRQ